MTPANLTDADVPEVIRAELHKRFTDVSVIRTWLIGEFSARRGAPYLVQKAGEDEQKEFAGWVLAQIIEVDALNTVRKKSFLQSYLFANMSDKADRVSQRGCLICNLHDSDDIFPITRIPIRIAPVSRQTIKADLFRAMQRAFADRLKDVVGSYSRSDHLCVALTFVLSPSRARADKDLDNMAKATMDAVSRALGLDDKRAHHLDLAKVISKKAEEYLFVRIAKSALNQHGNDTLVPVQHHRWDREPIILENWL